MKQFGTVFKFEFGNYVKKKSFVIVTSILLIAVIGVLCWPRISAAFFAGDGTGTAAAPAESSGGQTGAIALADAQGDGEETAAYYNAALAGAGYRFVAVDMDEAALKAAVESGEYGSALLITGDLGYKRIVQSNSLYDTFGAMFNEAMLSRYRTQTLQALGVPADEIAAYVSAHVQSEEVITETGKDSASNFLYTYILIMLLYFSVVMYGSLVSSSVATEKSTRAMELLVTSAKPSSLMFGKVMGAGLAGLTQFVLVLGTAFAAYNLNAGYFADNYIVQSIFAMPLSIMLYSFLFFILGFFIYAFLYAALASLVSRMEDLASATQPVTLVFIVAFMVVMFSVASGNVDNMAVLVCSFIPLTSPMAMFVRITMGQVAGWEIGLSVGILLASVVGIAYLAAGIYRLGVLLYGNRPKPGEIIRMIRANK